MTSTPPVSGRRPPAPRAQSLESTGPADAAESATTPTHGGRHVRSGDAGRDDRRRHADAPLPRRRRHPRRADRRDRSARRRRRGRACSTRTVSIVAPGFVDLHTHYDAQVFWDPYCSLSGWHGVTSVVIGNCGFGFAPVLPELRERSMLSMTRNEAIPLDAMQAGHAVGLGHVPRVPRQRRAHAEVGQPPAVRARCRRCSSGCSGSTRAKAGVLPTDAEHDEMCRLLDEAMDAGACGWSAQRLCPTGTMPIQRDYDGTPMPTDVMHDETCRVLARVLARARRGLHPDDDLVGRPRGRPWLLRGDGRASAAGR